MILDSGLLVWATMYVQCCFSSIIFLFVVII